MRPKAPTDGPCAARPPAPCSERSSPSFPPVDNGRSTAPSTVGSSGLRSALLRLHWLDVQRHVYGHSGHGAAATIPGGWESFIWRRDARKVALVCAAGATHLYPALDFIGGLGEGWTSVIEIEADDPIGDELVEAGYHVEYDLPGHFIPTSARFRNVLIDRVPGGIAPWRLVENKTALSDFAFVQDQAYRASYDWPKGCASLFYTDPASLMHPDALGVVLYDHDGVPVRTAAIVHKRGIVAGVAGAAIPAVRGQHLGEQAMFHLLFYARTLWGAENVHHITMPCARPIAERLGLETVTLYRRWRKP